MDAATRFQGMVGGIIDLFAGIGGDGRYGSSAETYEQPAASAQKPNIIINADKMELHAGRVEVHEAAPAVDHDAERAAQQEAWYRAQAEARQQHEEGQSR
jgi:hypothetical protein